MAETIFALSSGALPAGVAIIRTSGPKTRFGLETICGFVPVARQMRFAHFKDCEGLLIDSGLAVFFPAPASFTGEDCAEFHLHGSRATVRRCLSVLAGLPGFRMAQAGEFSKRAFINGKMDLTSAEGLSDLLNAETEAQRKLALLLAEGGLQRLYDGWRQRILRNRAMLEALIEFSDEDDVATRALVGLSDELGVLNSELSDHLGCAKAGEIVRDGFRVTIVGAPNAGKSSLLNMLTKRDAAIVSAEAGTTRDIVEVRLELDGHLVILADTAGLRDGAGTVERIGIERARDRGRVSDLLLVTFDATNPVEVDLDDLDAHILRVGTHADLLPADHGSDFDVLVSSTTGAGYDALLDLILECLSQFVPGGFMAPVRERQLALLNDASREISLAMEFVGVSPELAAEHLRLGGDLIGRLTGSIDVEELLDVVFGSFCIGK